MTSLTSKYSDKIGGVLWDVEDCPILNGLDPKSIYENIKSALVNQGYPGEVEITAYKEKEPIRNDFELAGNKHGRFNSMFDDKYVWTRSNLMIISRDKTDFTTYLGRFKNVLIAEPTKLPENCCKCGFALDEEPNIKPIKKGVNISYEWVWTSLAFGGDPIQGRAYSLTNKAFALWPRINTYILRPQITKIVL